MIRQATLCTFHLHVSVLTKHALPVILDIAGTALNDADRRRLPASARPAA